MEPDRPTPASAKEVAREILLNLQGLVEDGERILKRAREQIALLEQDD